MLCWRGRRPCRVVGGVGLAVGERGMVGRRCHGPVNWSGTSCRGNHREGGIAHRAGQGGRAAVEGGQVVAPVERNWARERRFRGHRRGPLP